MANNQSAYPVNSKVHSSRQILQRPQLSNVQIYTKNLSGVAYSPDRSQSSLGMVSPDRLERVMKEVQMVGQQQEVAPKFGNMYQQNQQANYLPNRAGSVIGSYSSAYGTGPSSEGVVNHFTTPTSIANTNNVRTQSHSVKMMSGNNLSSYSNISPKSIANNSSMTPSKTMTADSIQNQNPSTLISWVEIIDIASNRPMYANIRTGEVKWAPPKGAQVRKASKHQWWELFDEKTRRYYYYNRKEKISSWKKPISSNADVIPLRKLQDNAKTQTVQEAKRNLKKEHRELSDKMDKDKKNKKQEAASSSSLSKSFQEPTSSSSSIFSTATNFKNKSGTLDSNFSKNSLESTGKKEKKSRLSIFGSRKKEKSNDKIISKSMSVRDKISSSGTKFQNDNNNNTNNTSKHVKSLPKSSTSNKINRNQLPNNNNNNKNKLIMPNQNQKSSQTSIHPEIFQSSVSNYQDLVNLMEPRPASSASFMFQNQNFFKHNDQNNYYENQTSEKLTQNLSINQNLSEYDNEKIQTKEKLNFPTSSATLNQSNLSNISLTDGTYQNLHSLPLNSTFIFDDQETATNTPAASATPNDKINPFFRKNQVKLGISSKIKSQNNQNQSLNNNNNNSHSTTKTSNRSTLGTDTSKNSILMNLSNSSTANQIDKIAAQPVSPSSPINLSKIDNNYLELDEPELNEFNNSLSKITASQIKPNKNNNPFNQCQPASSTLARENLKKAFTKNSSEINSIASSSQSTTNNNSNNNNLQKIPLLNTVQLSDDEEEETNIKFQKRGDNVGKTTDNSLEKNKNSLSTGSKEKNIDIDDNNKNNNNILADNAHVSSLLVLDNSQSHKTADKIRPKPKFDMGKIEKEIEKLRKGQGSCTGLGM